jgi:alpha-N-acetylglucosaminidase
VLLPQIELAFVLHDLDKFRQLRSDWLRQIDQLNELTGTQESMLLGGWVAEAASWARSEEEKAQLEYDARSLLVQWGPEASRRSAIHDYSNREWNGLLLFYRERWRRYFDLLDAHLVDGVPLVPIDWFAMAEQWARKHEHLPTAAHGDVWLITKALCAQDADLYKQPRG